MINIYYSNISERILLLILFSLFVFSGGFAQSGGERAAITGIVSDSDGSPIPDATVSIIHPDNSELITGSSTNQSGGFSVRVDPGSYVVRISYISYTTYQQTVDIQQAEQIDLGKIALEQTAAELDDVVVEGERSYMEMNFDSRTFNVGADITSLGGSALDVLDNVPSITTDFEGNVSLRGNQGVQILINGRPSSLVRSGTDALSSIPSNMIEKIEVITNPSARYSADGTGGIINIILVDNSRLGFNGRVHGNTGYPHNHELGANMNYHVNNINWFISSSIEYQSRPRGGSTFQSFSADTTYVFRENRNSDQTGREGDLRFGADIYLPASQILTATTRIDIERGRNKTGMLYVDYDPAGDEVYRQVFDEWEIIQQTTREDVQESRENDFEFRLEYEKRFGSRDHRLTADADFEFGWEDDNSNLTETAEFASAEPLLQRSFSDEKYREFRLDVDYEQPMGDDSKFEAGMRSNFDWMDNDYLVEEFQENQWIVPENLGVSDNFTYFENVNALYSIFAAGAGDFTYHLGLRAENTRIQTRLDQTEEGSNQNYLNLFPSAFLSYRLNDKNSFQGKLQPQNFPSLVANAAAIHPDLQLTKS